MIFSLKNIIKKRIYAFLDYYNEHQEREKINLIRSQLKVVGNSFHLGKDYIIKNPQYISIGENFMALDRFRIEAWDELREQKFTPKIEIGENVSFNTDIHIGCINHIKIGNNCLFASRIYITDHQHGDTSIEMLKVSPNKRPLISAGPVVIEDNVWIGEGVAILSNVTIGENSIVGTNAVVTKSIPKNSVAVGIPARVIKTIG
jgi:acetyltransferase-like isoleucine patch superfamily enzyme